MTYRKICQAYWEGDLAVALRGDCEAHAVAFYLMTCPASNAIGLYRIALPTICDDLGIDAEVASEALDRLSGERVRDASPTRSRRVQDALQTPFILVDGVYRMLWVVELARHEWGEAPNPQSNQVKGLVKMMDSFVSVGRKSALWADFKARYSPGWDPVFDLMKDAFGTRSERVGDASPTRSRLSLARASGSGSGSGSGTLDPDQDLEEEKRAGAPDVVRCAQCEYPVPASGYRPGCPVPHLDTRGQPCVGSDVPGLALEDPDEVDNPHGPEGECFCDPAFGTDRRCPEHGDSPTNPDVLGGSVQDAAAARAAERASLKAPCRWSPEVAALGDLLTQIEKDQLDNLISFPSEMGSPESCRAPSQVDERAMRAERVNLLAWIVEMTPMDPGAEDQATTLELWASWRRKARAKAKKTGASNWLGEVKALRLLVDLRPDQIRAALLVADEKGSLKATKAERTVEFDEWWPHYPNKTGRREALASWCRIPDKERPSAQEIIDFCTRASNTRRWCLGYAKGGAPFVNQRAWEDDLAAYDAGGNDGRLRSFSEAEQRSELDRVHAEMFGEEDSIEPAPEYAEEPT